MHTSSIVLDLILFVSIAALLVYFIARLVRRGISQKYERKPIASKSKNSWSALSDGKDPTV